MKTQYILVTEYKPLKLTSRMEELVKEGYEPLGNHQTTFIPNSQNVMNELIYTQMMVKYTQKCNG